MWTEATGLFGAAARLQWDEPESRLRYRNLDLVARYRATSVQNNVASPANSPEAKSQ